MKYVRISIVFEGSTPMPYIFQWQFPLNNEAIKDIEEIAESISAQVAIDHPHLEYLYKAINYESIPK